jgi:hypothetical protein
MPAWPDRAPRLSPDAAPVWPDPTHARARVRAPSAHGAATAAEAPSEAESRGSGPTRMEQHGARICRLAEESTTAGDPVSALRTLTELRSELDEFVRLQVGRGLAAGRSFAELARALGISRQAAHRRYRELAPARKPRRLVATDEARRVVRLAHEETRATGATAVGSLQLLLGILRTDGDAARALKSEGVTLERTRACGRTAGCARDGGDDSGSLRRMLKRAGRLALADGERHLRTEQLLLAALADPDSGASRTLTALDATPNSIRARLGR